MDPLIAIDPTLPGTDFTGPDTDLERRRTTAELEDSLSYPLDSSCRLSGEAMLEKILSSSLILGEDWESVSPSKKEILERCTDPAALLELLVTETLLTPYQASRLKAGKFTGMILGNYRVLDRIGTGAMGVVYKGEHLRMRHTVAIKVLSLSAEEDPQLLARFYAEMRAVARLHHPNIVAAMDAGETHGQKGEPTLHYFVMEYVQGDNLEKYVIDNGPMSPARACLVIYQVAKALEEANKHNLVHRDIKPSNILLTPEDQAKLLDFGLAMHFRSRMTVPGVILGTMDYMAPEQACDASSVDVRADIYSLGATFYWCLTGQTPFPAQENLRQDLIMRMSQTAPSVRAVLPSFSTELDAVLGRMMALQPDDRYPTPQAVTRALLVFVERDNLLHHAQSTLQAMVPLKSGSTFATSMPGATPAPDLIHRILVVDDEEDIRRICQSFLEGDDAVCDAAASGAIALEMLSAQPYDLVLLDENMPGMTGLELVRRLRASPPSTNLKIVMFSGHMNPDEMARSLDAGVDDFLGKPFSGIQLVARIKACLRHKDAEDRSDRLANLLLTVNAELEKGLTSREIDLVHTRNVLVLAMARIVEQRLTLMPGHLNRMQRYCRVLAEEASQLPVFAGVIDKDYIEMIACCVPLYDIGMAAVPDHILLKPDKLSGEDRILMEQHTTIGANTLLELVSSQQRGTLLAFMQMAGDICRHHHEHFDGTGYPNQLKGNAIPLSARLAAIADVYDALRSWRSYRPAMSHRSALQIMKVLSEGYFDPLLLPVFERCGPRFEEIFHETGD